MLSKRFLLLLVLFVSLMAPALVHDSCAAVRTPLLQDGKKTLLQRVISHPGAYQAEQPGQTFGKQVSAFTPFYVYSRTTVNGEDWVEISPSTKAEKTGWIKASSCSDWNQSLTLLFADRMGRDPVLFFREQAQLNALVTSPNMRATIDTLLRGKDTPSSPLLAMEPQGAALSRQHFYLMPVFEYSDEYEQFGLNMIHVGLVDPGNSRPAPMPAPVQQAQPAPAMRAGIVFIMDTTISMGPYIEECKNFISSSYDKLAQSDIANDVSFAVVAYRNNTQYNPKIEYVSKIITPFTPVGNRAQAEARLGDMNEATVSTHSFNEDAFAGIKTAIDDLAWSPYSVRVAVLVTDAGAIRNDDPLSGTGLNEEELVDLLAQKGIRLVVIHLQSPKNKKSRIVANTRQYQKLTTVGDGNVKSAYIPLKVNSTASASKLFVRISEALVDVLTKIVDQASKGRPVQAPVKAAAPQEPVAAAGYMAERLGYAAYLEFAGKRENISVPRVVSAWTVDKDLDDLVNGKPTYALIPAVLLDKRQLDTLARQISLLVEAARTSRESSQSFFQRLVSLSSQTVQNPDLLQSQPNANLSTLGLLPEFLQGLPYKSDIMKLTEVAWNNMSRQEQDDHIRVLESKLKLYSAYHNDTANWESFGATDPGDALYRVPLTSLP